MTKEITTLKDEVEIISIERLEGGTVRTMVKIKEHLFKRLSHPLYPVVWEDMEYTINNCLAMTKDQEKDLEGIFLAYAEKLKK